MQLKLPNGATPQLTVQEGNPATMEVKDPRQISDSSHTFRTGDKFGFVPTFRTDDDSRVVVSIFDMKAEPNRQLGQVEVAVGGDAVQSETTPPFTISVPKVIAAR
jgi:hypothetical protein